MGFAPDASQATVNLVLVAFGVNDRILASIRNAVEHESAADFAVTCVVNPRPGVPHPDVSQIPAGVRVVVADLNLGWPGGLHLGRRQVESEFIGWMEDDMLVLDEPDGRGARAPRRCDGAVRVVAAHRTLAGGDGAGPPVTAPLVA